MVMLGNLLTLTGISMQVECASKFLMVRVLLQPTLTGQRHNTTTREERHKHDMAQCRVVLALQYVGVGTVWSDFRRMRYEQELVQ
jgi:hypothetical protein